MASIRSQARPLITEAMILEGMRKAHRERAMAVRQIFAAIGRGASRAFASARGERLPQPC